MGRATAILTASLGASIIAVDIDREKLNETISLLSGRNHRAFVLNLLEQDDLTELFDDAVSDGTKLNGLVHCAGMSQVLPLNMLTREKAQKEMCLNYLVYIELIRQYAKTKHSIGGSIVGISSIASAQPEQCQTNYAASKAAMDTATRALAPELAKKKIRINTILPGATNTQMAAQANGRDIDAILSKQLLGMAEPEDIAYACAYLLSDMSRMMTGRQLFIDCGRLI